MPVMIFVDTSLIAFKNSVEFWAATTSRADLNIVAAMILTPQLVVTLHMGGSAGKLKHQND